MASRPIPILAPSDGTVAYQYVEEGARVEEGDTVAAVELMKMFNDIPAPCAGTVHFRVGLGEVVAVDDVVAEIVPD